MSLPALLLPPLRTRRRRQRMQFRIMGSALAILQRCRAQAAIPQTTDCTPPPLFALLERARGAARACLHTRTRVHAIAHVTFLTCTRTIWAGRLTTTPASWRAAATSPRRSMRRRRASATTGRGAAVVCLWCQCFAHNASVWPFSRRAPRCLLLGGGGQVGERRRRTLRPLPLPPPKLAAAAAAACHSGY